VTKRLKGGASVTLTGSELRAKGSERFGRLQKKFEGLKIDRPDAIRMAAEQTAKEFGVDAVPETGREFLPATAAGAPAAPVEAPAGVIGPQDEGFGPVLPFQPGEQVASSPQDSPENIRSNLRPQLKDKVPAEEQAADVGTTRAYPHGQGSLAVDAALEEASRPRPDESLEAFVQRRKEVTKGAAEYDKIITDPNKLSLWIDENGNPPRTPM
jgi:hypothetical protein